MSLGLGHQVRLWSMCICLVLSGLHTVKSEAQTLTPSNTPVGLPTLPSVGTVTPSGTQVPNQVNCPPFPVYYDEVDLSYARVCYRCMSERPTPTKSVGNGLPSYNLPKIPLFTPTITPTGTITPFFDPDATYYPTATPYGLLGTDVPTWTPSPTFTPTATPYPSLTIVHVDFSQAISGYGQGWILSPNGVAGYEFDIASNYRIYNPNLPSSLGFTLSRFDDEPIYVIGYEYTYNSGTRGCSGTCGNAPAIFSSYSGGYVLEDTQIGYPGYHYPYFEGYDYDLSKDVNGWVESMQFGVTLFGSPATNNDYIEHLFITYITPETLLPTSTPTNTPTITQTPDLTLTAAPTMTPSGFIDCSMPFGQKNYDQAVSLQVSNFIGETCPLTVVPNIDMSSIDERLVIPQVDLCIKWVGLPVIALFGLNIPLGMIVAVIALGYLIRRLAEF